MRAHRQKIDGVGVEETERDADPKARERAGDEPCTLESAPGKQHAFMVRCKIPGGRVTAAQYLALDDLAGRYANGTLRFTSR